MTLVSVLALLKGLWPVLAGLAPVLLPSIARWLEHRVEVDVRIAAEDRVQSSDARRELAAIGSPDQLAVALDDALRSRRARRGHG